MKANQKFLRRDDAVSPVIAVILMVAITVVLAATVYVWVSGFGASSGTAAKTVSLTVTKEGSLIAYTVTSGTPGMRWSDLKFSVAGLSTAYSIVTSDGDASARGTTTTYTPSSTSTIDAGDRFYIVNGVTTAGGISGVEVTLLDTGANSVMGTFKGGRADEASTSTAPTITGAQRISGTAGTFTSGVTRFTMSAPLVMADLAIGDLTATSRVFTDSTITIRSPTQFDVNWGAGTTLVTGDTLTLAAGTQTTAAGSATTSPATLVMTASM